jgi:GH24 family phage-related lysozyme (muramidase)
MLDLLLMEVKSFEINDYFKYIKQGDVLAATLQLARWNSQYE